MGAIQHILANEVACRQCALVSLKDQWSGTLVLVAQPAEEIVAGARC